MLEKQPLSLESHLQPTMSEIPFKYIRKQFPMKVALALTINKSQGQSVKYVGLDLQTPIFSHG
jgi:ATP-dependent DNA helicase PIF1